MYGSVFRLFIISWLFVYHSSLMEKLHCLMQSLPINYWWKKFIKSVLQCVASDVFYDHVKLVISLRFLIERYSSFILFKHLIHYFVSFFVKTVIRLKKKLKRASAELGCVKVLWAPQWGVLDGIAHSVIFFSFFRDSRSA